MSPLVQNIPGGSPPPEKVTVLLVSSDKDDENALMRVLSGDEWVIAGCRCLSETENRLSPPAPSIVVCERNLPDGDWRDMLDRLDRLPDPPALIVMCRHADEKLWAEVLNRGAYDLLLKPFDTAEVIRICRMASRCRAIERH
jgi:DNA-binding NtrC family response regulator